MFDTVVGTQTAGGERDAALRRFAAVRRDSEALAAPLTAEDQVIQSMPDVSPTKWHLAHTSWFFETFILTPHASGYRPFDPAFAYLFNSYYEAAGARHPRPERGLLSRPTVDAVLAYRDHVTAGMLRLIETAVRTRIPAYLLVNNRAEGCAPLTIAAVARSLRPPD